MGATQGTYNAEGGLLSRGVPVEGIARGKTYGRHWYVHGNSGSDTGNDGKTQDRPFLTMAKAFTMIASGDTIHFNGNISEHITSPIGAQDITIIGESNRHRHADTHPGNGELSGATWKSAGTNSPLLTLRNHAWTFDNVLWVAHASNYAVVMERNAIETAAGEYDASHATFVRCRFASGAGGISDTGGCFNVVVRDCVFQALTTACILGVGNIGQGQTQWVICNNTFNEMTNGVKIAAFNCVVSWNHFTDGGTPNTTYVLNMSNGGGGGNWIHDNFFQGTTANFNTPDVVGNATDVWMRNYAIDSTAAGVGSSFEAGNPA